MGKVRNRIPTSRVILPASAIQDWNHELAGNNHSRHGDPWPDALAPKPNVPPIDAFLEACPGWLEGQAQVPGLWVVPHQVASFPRMSQYTVYLVLQLAPSLLFSLVFTVSMLYQVTVVELSPLQLVLVGTSLEATIFLFEVPTGVVADVSSRRLSVIIGYALIGVGFVVGGSLPFFLTVVLGQVLWGFSYAFTSGATQAWIADEIGKERAGEAFLHGSQLARAGALIAIPISVFLGTLDIRPPKVLGGGLVILFAGFLAVVMREEGFMPTPPGIAQAGR
jgi:MFS family permease